MALFSSPLARRLATYAALAAVAAAALFFVLHDIPFAELRVALSVAVGHLRYGPLMLAFAAYLSLILLHATRFAVVVGSAAPTSFRTGFVAYGVANLLNTFVPARAGDLYKATFASKQTALPFAQVLGLATVDLALWGGTCIFLIGFGVIFASDFVAQIPGLKMTLFWVSLAGMVGAVGLGALSLTWATKHRAPSNRLLARLWSFLHGVGEALTWSVAWRAVTISVLGWGAETLIPFFLSAALDRPLTFMQSFWTVIAVSMALVVPSPGGVGPWEVAATSAYQLIGAGKAEAFLFASFYHLIFIGMAVMLGILALGLSRRRQISLVRRVTPVSEPVEASPEGSDA